MAKLGTLVSAAVLAATLALAAFTGGPADAGDPCVRTDFKTDLVKQACTKGGQAEAKDAMKQFNKDHKIKSCNQCHAKLAPNYELKPDGLDQFQKLGGK